MFRIESPKKLRTLSLRKPDWLYLPFILTQAACSIAPLFSFTDFTGLFEKVNEQVLSGLADVGAQLLDLRLASRQTKRHEQPHHGPPREKSCAPNVLRQGGTLIVFGASEQSILIFPGLLQRILKMRKPGSVLAVKEKSLSNRFGPKDHVPDVHKPGTSAVASFSFIESTTMSTFTVCVKRSSCSWSFCIRFFSNIKATQENRNINHAHAKKVLI